MAISQNSRRRLLAILPEPVRGRALTKSIDRGILKAAMQSRRNRVRSPAVASRPAWSATTAWTDSPQRAWADHRGLLHRRVLHQGVLHLGRGCTVASAPARTPVQHLGSRPHLPNLPGWGFANRRRLFIENTPPVPGGRTSRYGGLARPQLGEGTPGEEHARPLGRNDADIALRNEGVLSG